MSKTERKLMLEIARTLAFASYADRNALMKLVREVEEEERRFEETILLATAD